MTSPNPQGRPQSLVAPLRSKPNLRMLVDFEHGDGSLEALDITSLSDGYRTHFSLVVDIARRMVQLNPSDDLNASDRGTSSEAVILIDEIDLHLDPTWQARVVQGLRVAFPRAQFVLTTHSEQVIGSVPARSVRKLVAGDGEVLVENVAFAEGATSERILIELMGAKQLRAELDTALPPGDEPANRLKVELQAPVGLDGPSRELIDDWKKRFPSPTAESSRAKKPAAERDDDEREEDAEP